MRTLSLSVQRKRALGYAATVAAAAIALGGTLPAVDASLLSSADSLAAGRRRH
jgi:hypothetical protein